MTFDLIKYSLRVQLLHNCLNYVWSVWNIFAKYLQWFSLKEVEQKFSIDMYNTVTSSYISKDYQG